MRKIGAFEAKTHLSSLLDAVANSEEVVITKRGRPVARLDETGPAQAVPPGAPETARRQVALARVRALRGRLASEPTGAPAWSAADILAARDEGRR